MRYEHVDCFAAALAAAKAAYDFDPVNQQFAHTVLSHREVSPKGDKAIPPRPCILVGIPQSHPALRRNGRWLDELAFEETRVTVAVYSALMADNGAGRMLDGYAAQHLPAVNFVRNFLLSNNAIDVPESLHGTLGMQPLALRPDDPMDGFPGNDNDGYRHTFFAVVADMEVLWPL